MASPLHYVNNEYRQRFPHGRPEDGINGGAGATAEPAGNHSSSGTSTLATDPLQQQQQQQQHKRRRRVVMKRHGKGGIWWNHLSSKSKTGKKPTIFQTFALLFFFTAMLNVWHYMRTSWWTHGRLAERHARLLRASTYEAAEDRIRQVHHETFQANMDDELFDSIKEQRQVSQQEDVDDGGHDQDISSSSDREQQQELDDMEDEHSQLSAARLQEQFLEQRQSLQKLLMSWLHKIDSDIINNVHGGIQWIRPNLLPPLPGQQGPKARGTSQQKNSRRQQGPPGPSGEFFEVLQRDTTHFAWQDEWEELVKQEIIAESTDNNNDENMAIQTARIARKLAVPAVDYTDAAKYRYPQPLLEEPPVQGGYPQMTTLGSLMENWDQDEDFHGTITETLMHFNFSNPVELQMARKFRDAELPFKLTNVPELAAANLKWTDEYLSKHFDRKKNPGSGFSYSPELGVIQGIGGLLGFAQEATTSFMAFFKEAMWDVETMGVPPVRNNDLSFQKWAQHAHYADAVQLSADQPHFYWQAGIAPQERELPPEKQNFISRDLPSFSSTTANFISFHPEVPNGIECRFGERGVVAATHYDMGRNMVGMITGAKRYILSPPKACSKLGISTETLSPIYRHSLLNFGHLKYLNNGNKRSDEVRSLSGEERAWLERAACAEVVETVLKEGEILYIGSHWFHYIISLQKSAQCNVRSDIHFEGTREFGGARDVEECIG